MSTSSIDALSYVQQNAHAAATSSQTAGTNATATGGLAANEGTFLTLLVSQLKNQNPLNPADSTQFVSEPAQFSSLEQLMNINQNVGTITNTVSGAKSATTASDAFAGSASTSAAATSTAGSETVLNGIG